MGWLLSGIASLLFVGALVTLGISLIHYGMELGEQMPTPYLGNAVFWGGVAIIAFVVFNVFSQVKHK